MVSIEGMEFGFVILERRSKAAYCKCLLAVGTGRGESNRRQQAEEEEQEEEKKK